MFSYVLKLVSRIGLDRLVHINDSIQLPQLLDLIYPWTVLIPGLVEPPVRVSAKSCRPVLEIIDHAVAVLDDQMIGETPPIAKDQNRVFSAVLCKELATRLNSLGIEYLLSLPLDLRQV